jgi:hypothetical protein
MADKDLLNKYSQKAKDEAKEYASKSWLRRAAVFAGVGLVVVGALAFNNPDLLNWALELGREVAAAAAEPTPAPVDITPTAVVVP